MAKPISAPGGGGGGGGGRGGRLGGGGVWGVGWGGFEHMPPLRF